MKKEKVFIEGYEVGFLSGTDGTREKKIQVASGEIVSIDEHFIYKSIEPEKVKVPQYVADWYEEHKDDFDYTLWEYLVDWDRQNPSDFKEWIAEGDKYDPLITLVNMHQFGYEVEEEKRYIVSLKNGQPLVKAPLGGNFYFNQNITAGNCKATRKELEEAGFGWIFSCEGIEVEEVE